MSEGIYACMWLLILLFIFLYIKFRGNLVIRMCRVLGFL